MFEKSCFLVESILDCKVTNILSLIDRKDVIFLNHLNIYRKEQVIAWYKNQSFIHFYAQFCQKTLFIITLKKHTLVLQNFDFFLILHTTIQGDWDNWPSSIVHDRE